METTPNTHGLIRRSEAILLIAHTHRLKEAELDRNPSQGLSHHPSQGQSYWGALGQPQPSDTFPGMGTGRVQQGAGLGVGTHGLLQGTEPKQGQQRGTGASVRDLGSSGDVWATTDPPQRGKGGPGSLS